MYIPAWALILIIFALVLAFLKREEDVRNLKERLDDLESRIDDLESNRGPHDLEDDEI
jgi:chaperonin cofactor prefoldin